MCREAASSLTVHAAHGLDGLGQRPQIGRAGLRYRVIELALGDAAGCQTYGGQRAYHGNAQQNGEAHPGEQEGDQHGREHLVAFRARLTESGSCLGLLPGQMVLEDIEPFAYPVEVPLAAFHRLGVGAPASRDGGGGELGAPVVRRLFCRP